MEEDMVLRLQNRALRTVNRNLRANVRDLTYRQEATFALLCETETEAERALRELWEGGGFECGPQDYQEIVGLCLAALRYIAIPHEPHRAKTKDDPWESLEWISGGQVCSTPRRPEVDYLDSQSEELFDLS